MESKKGQVTIFVIIAILIVASVLVYYLFIKPNYIGADGGRLNFEVCIEDAVEEEIEVIGEQAGFVEPEFYYLYQDDKVGYLCYTNLYLKPCVMQKPFLTNHFKSELKKAVGEKVARCYENSISELKRKGYEVISGDVDLDISLNPGQIVVKVDAPTSVTRETTKSFQTFRTVINSEVYDLLMLSTSILQYEAQYGDAAVDSFLVFYPDVLVQKMKQSDGTTIYMLEDKSSKIKFQFASRSWAWPAGYGVSEGFE